MKWKTLKCIADTDSITTKACPDLGYVVVVFTVNGNRIEGQFDADNDGIYGITLSGTALVGLLGRDEKGHPIAETEEPI